MKTTKPLALVGLAALAGVVSFMAELLLVRLGEPQFIPPITLGVALGFIGVIIPVMAWPIRQFTTSDKPETKTPIDPFYATRVLLLAKAGALTGAVLTGVGAGIVVFVLTGAAIAATPLVLTLVTVVGGLILGVGGVVAERWCQVPPTDQDTQSVPGGEAA
jgi:hypothetical protein